MSYAKNIVSKEKRERILNIVTINLEEIGFSSSDSIGEHVVLAKKITPNEMDMAYKAIFHSTLLNTKIFSTTENRISSGFNHVKTFDLYIYQDDYIIANNIISSMIRLIKICEVTNFIWKNISITHSEYIDFNYGRILYLHKNHCKISINNYKICLIGGKASNVFSKDEVRYVQHITNFNGELFLKKIGEIYKNEIVC